MRAVFPEVLSASQSLWQTTRTSQPRRLSRRLCRRWPPRRPGRSSRVTSRGWRAKSINTTHTGAPAERDTDEAEEEGEEKEEEEGEEEEEEEGEEQEDGEEDAGEDRLSGVSSDARED
uniref:Uncharacterized protein n=1 Tax=Toxoplasma gondii TgCATBr9 TaxID=943120 RepID=A0A2T6ID46_TOXGO|nr:hypothetical protein TGBR9_385530 [Toxoplasma gondii TgCATBr9]